MKFDDDESEMNEVIYSRVTRSGYGGRNRAEVAIDLDGVLLVKQPDAVDTAHAMTPNELSVVAAVCRSEPVLDLPESVDLGRSRSGSTSTVFSLPGQTVTVNDLALGADGVPPALVILNDLFDNLMKWS